MKKIIISATLLVIIIIGIFTLFKLKDRIVSTITLDINPSIEINLDKNDSVVSIKALNEDAKKVINSNLKGKSLEETLNNITQKVIENNYIEDNQAVVIIYTKGKIKNEVVERKVSDSFGKENIHTEIVIIDNITESDKELSKKYNISIAKAAYINLVSKENEKVNIKDLVNKSAREINETIQTGNYCNDGYSLEGDWCKKEISSSSAKQGKVCPEGYFEEKGICYEEAPFEETDNITCREEFELIDNNCVRTMEDEPVPDYYCEQGEFKTEGEIRWHNWKGGPACVDTKTGVAPTQRCLTINHIMINGECADGPKPTINGGCEPGDYLVNGGCYTKDNLDQWVCPDGGIYEKSKGTYVEICPDTLTYTKPSIKGYTCHEGFILKDNKCIKEETEKPQKERICKEGYTKVDFDRCINYNKTVSKTDGYYCEGENTRLKGNMCITYEYVEANHY